MVLGLHIGAIEQGEVLELLVVSDEGDGDERRVFPSATVLLESNLRLLVERFRGVAVGLGQPAQEGLVALLVLLRKKYSFTAKLAGGKQKLEIAFLNDAYKENEYDRNFFLHAVQIRKK